MKEYKIGAVRNIGVIAHEKAGKTSIAEAILYDTGATDRLGRVGDTSSIMDFDPDEISRGITINSSLAYCDWKDTKINIIDTPGSANFIADTQGCMRVIDGAVVVIDAESGVQIQTEKVWGWADDYEIPRVVFVNKMDHDRANHTHIFDNIKKIFRYEPIRLQLPIGEGNSFKGVIDLLRMKSLIFSGDGNGRFEEGDIPVDMKDTVEQQRERLIETVAETNDRLLERYLDKGELSGEEIREGLKNGILSGKLVPILYGSAINNQGIQPLLDVIVDYLPSPEDRPPVKGVDLKTKDEVYRKASPDEPLSALVFKTIADPYAGKLTIFRVYSGRLNSDSTVYNSTKGVKERVGQIYYIQGKKQTGVSSVYGGDLAAVAKLKSTVTGDTFSDEKNPVIFEGIKFPEPVISFAVVPKAKGDEEKVSASLSRLMEEDPSLKVSRNPQTRELLISGMGAVHLEVIIERLKRKFGVDVTTKPPNVPYKETIHSSTNVQGKYKKQSGGRGQYGDTWLKLEPLPRGKGFEFVDKIVGGAIPKQYIPAVEKGVIEATGKGVLAGYPVIDIKVTLYDGSFHEVDSSELAFKIAGSLGFKKGMVECNPVLLEPIMNMEIIVLEENMGDVIGDLNARRGKILGVIPHGHNQVIKARVPMAEVLKYASDLRSITGGRGSFSMEFAIYEEVPNHISEKIIAETKKETDT
ncbi:MAG: elongation factor G [Nitrospinae bacterium]|nr:elongation factor G [Nitrospinota bacterium]